MIPIFYIISVTSYSPRAILMVLLFIVFLFLGVCVSSALHFSKGGSDTYAFFLVHAVILKTCTSNSDYNYYNEVVYIDQPLQAMEESKDSWTSLFERFPFFEAYKNYLQIDIAAENDDDLRKWKGWVESRLRLLTLKVRFHFLLLFGEILFEWHANYFFYFDYPFI